MAVDVVTGDLRLVGSGGPQLTQHEIDSGNLGTGEHIIRLHGQHPFQGENAVGDMAAVP